MNIKALVIDDDKIARQNLIQTLQEISSKINVIASVDSAERAREVLKTDSPNVVFLDIAMPVENGFSFLESIPEQSFKTVFVTAYSEYALKAIKAGAFDYLLKPLDKNELDEVIKRIESELNKDNTINNTEPLFAEIEKLHILFNNLKNGMINKIIIHHAKGYKVVDVNSIVFIEGNGNYTNVYLSDETVILCTKILKDFEEILDENLFIRIHKSYLINLVHLKEYENVDGGYVVLSNNKKISIARTKVALLHKTMTDYNNKK